MTRLFLLRSILQVRDSILHYSIIACFCHCYRQLKAINFRMLQLKMIAVLNLPAASSPSLIADIIVESDVFGHQAVILQRPGGRIDEFCRPRTRLCQGQVFQRRLSEGTNILFQFDTSSLLLQRRRLSSAIRLICWQPHAGSDRRRETTSDRHQAR